MQREPASAETQPVIHNQLTLWDSSSARAATTATIYHGNVSSIGARRQPKIEQRDEEVRQIMRYQLADRAKYFRPVTHGSY
jgi:hypothetical protein